VSKNFTWVPLYQELAQKLISWQGRQIELITFLEELRAEGHVITPLNDRGHDGRRFLLQEIDPFTFFGVFNRGIRHEQRMAILGRVR
jgi:5-methylcytosine-specific restriction protein B